MRARTTIAATAVVTIALVLVGVLVVLLLRQSLVGSAELKAEVTARTVAGQVAAGTAPASLDLPDGASEVVQVVNTAGTVVATGDELEGDPPITGAPGPQPAQTSDDDDDDDDHGRGGDDDDSYDGVVDPNVKLDTVSIPGQDGRYRVATMTATTPDGDRLTVHSGVSLEDEQKAIDDVTTTMLLALPLLLAVVALVTWMVTRRALRPVSAIRAELAEITAGDLSRRVPVPDTRDEIHDLATTTNHTLAALDTAVEQQRRFIADASHELRSPLAILRAQLEVAAAHPELFNLEATLGDVVRLQSLATDLLLLARLDAGERPPAARVELTELVRETVARRAATDRVPVRLRVEEEDIVVPGVRGHLERMLANLLDNAQHHARSGVWVSLGTTSAAAAVLAVSDDGAGIPATQRDRVFDRFVRLDESRSRDAGGAGLGLAIVRDVVTAHRGQVEIAEAPEGGARFVIRLPRVETEAS